MGWISLKDDNYKYVVCNKCEKESGDRNKYEDYVNNKDLGDITLSMLKKMTFKNFKTTQQDSNLSDAKIASTNFSNDPKGWLLLTGATGVGKTHLAVAIAGNRIRDFKPIYFGFLPNILEKLRNFNNNQPDNYFNFLVEHPFLIIDDLGSQTNTTWAEEKIYQLIVSRHNNALPTVITTRATELKDELSFNPHIKDAILSRLIDRKLVDQHLMSAKDFRV
ncbi:MAG: ATP-binding protein [Chloroflexota bacterium]|nr:ATP-binding protein [Chloroflexota bacterium]MEC8713513.1 ATP-binding protein [Chloroflexota bacterium]MEC8750089.1 ATP-binding protein [Chloroflexota bacterium]MEE2620997.1 ATP-binding protein [Chloroflexota bacterium]GIR91406.1 MAG: ATP-binding protein [Chloroflexota bacterium]